MANIGDKFIIEIDEKYIRNNIPTDASNINPDYLYKIKGFNSLVFDEVGISKLKKMPDISETLNDYHEGYRIGSDYAWEVCDEVVRIFQILENEEIERIFNINVIWGDSITKEVMKLPFNTIKERLTDARSDFQIGDIVADIYRPEDRMIVTEVGTKHLRGIVNNKIENDWLIKTCIKTGSVTRVKKTRSEND